MTFLFLLLVLLAVWRRISRPPWLETKPLVFGGGFQTGSSPPESCRPYLVNGLNIGLKVLEVESGQS